MGSPPAGSVRVVGGRAVLCFDVMWLPAGRVPSFLVGIYICNKPLVGRRINHPFRLCSSRQDARVGQMVCHARRYFSPLPSISPHHSGRDCKHGFIRDWHGVNRLHCACTDRFAAHLRECSCMASGLHAYPPHAPSNRRQFVGALLPHGTTEMVALHSDESIPVHA